MSCGFSGWITGGFIAGIIDLLGALHVCLAHRGGPQITRYGVAAFVKGITIKDALINSSCRRRPASIALIYMDPGLRRDDDGTGIAQLHQITVQLPDTAPLLAMPPGLAKQPAGQGQLIIIQLGWTFTGGIKWFNHPTGQILANRIAAQAVSSGYLSNRHPITEMPSSDYT